MKVFLIAVFLAIMQTAPPVPRQAADSPANTSGSVKSNAKGDKKPTNVSPPVKAQPTEYNEENSDGKRKENTENSVAISKLPPVTVTSPKRDWADWGTWGFNFLLLGTSALQVWLLCRTLTFIRRQTHEMKKQRVTMGGQLRTMQSQLATMEKQTTHIETTAEAAFDTAETTKQSIAMQISKERARITVDKPKKLSLAESKPLGKIDYKVQVWAPTLAIIVEARAYAQVADSRDFDRWFTGSMGITSTDTRTTTVIERSSFLLHFVDDELIKSINTKERFVHFYGFIKYRDAFQSEKDAPHETTFSYLWEVGTDVLPPVVQGGFTPMPKIGERYISEWVEHPPGSNTET